MKRSMILSTCVLVVLAGAVAADPVQVGTVKITRVSGYYSGDGGEFTIYDTTLGIGGYTTDTSAKYAPANSFQTFCLERDEYVLPPNEAKAELDDVAYQGGLGGGTPDPLDPMTAYLYTKFATGTLSNYTYAGAGRQADAAQLQLAIWYIEDELGSTWDGTEWVKPDATGTLGAGSKALAWYNEALNAAWDTIGNVRVLNLYTNTTRQDYQSQLYLVPIPGAALLGFLGFGWAGLKLRKRV